MYPWVRTLCYIPFQLHGMVSPTATSRGDHNGEVAALNSDHCEQVQLQTSCNWSSMLTSISILPQTQPPPSSMDVFARGYDDYLQSPLQVCVVCFCGAKIEYPSNSSSLCLNTFCSRFLPASCALCARPAGPKITLRFPRLYMHMCMHMCVHTYHVRNNYVTYIVAMRPY